MGNETIVAVYDTPAHAELAVADLVQSGIPASAIETHSAAGAAGSTQVREKGFWASLFGGESEYDGDVYDRSVASGSTVVTVKAQASRVDSAMEILERHRPVDIDDRAGSYGLTQSASPMEPAAASLPVATSTSNAAVGAVAGGSLLLSEESLNVGKRVVNRGGTRIRRYVVETPVQETVNLHDETVTLERRPVTDGQLTGAPDFTDKVIEMKESVEEAVVSKTARVVEEVSLHKQVTDRVETIHDTVRKEEVEIEKLSGDVPSRSIDPRINP